MKTRFGICTFGAFCVAVGLLCSQGAIDRWGLQAQENAATASPLRYDVRQIRLGNGNRQVIRFNPVSGEAWMLEVDKWKKIAEVGTVGPGEFDIHLLEGPERTNWWVFRFDRLTGKGWNLGDFKWFEAWPEPT